MTQSSAAALRPSLGIIGFGRFGKALAELAQTVGISVRAWDAAPEHEKSPRHKLLAGSLAELCEQSTMLALAMPVGAIEKALEALAPLLRPDHICFDVGSVKSKPLALFNEYVEGVCPWVCTHPLFGPVSLARGQKPLRVVVCPDGGHVAAQRAVESLYERLGCEIHERSVAEHDQFMAETHAMAFYVAKGLLDMGINPDAHLSPPSFQGMLHSVQAVQADAGHLFYTIQQDNPYSSSARERLRLALTSIEEQLEQPHQPTSSARLAIPQATANIPNLAAERELIDEVDRELLQLLARRNRIALRAGQAKAAQGKPVRDPGREQALLQTRREWAAEQGLEPDDTRALFEWIMGQSRRLQAQAKSAGSGESEA